MRNYPSTDGVYKIGPDDSNEYAASQAEAQSKQKSGNGFLSAPLSGPIRPLSPDTLSNLSTDEYNEIRLGHLPSRHFTGGQSHEAKPEITPRGWYGKVRALWTRNLGLCYMLIAQVFGTLMNVTTRLLEVEGNNGKGLHPFQILFARMSITVVLASGYMYYRKTPYFPLGMPEVRWLLVARGFGGFFGVFGMYYSLLYLPLADATVITFLAPSLACWACSILINEPFGRLEQIAGLVSLVGVALIARPTSLFAAFASKDSPPATGNSDVMPGGNSTGAASGEDADASSYEDVTPEQRLAAVGIALVGVLGAATAYTTIRWIGKRAHPLISVNYFAVWSTIVSTFMMLVLPDVGFLLPADAKEWAYLIFLGTCGFIMQFLLAAGLAYEKSSRATNMTYTQMLFALTFDKLIFGHTPDLMSIAGSTLIVGSALYVATFADTGSGQDKSTTVGSASTRQADDEEAGQGLIHRTGDSPLDQYQDEEHGQRPIEEVQMRNLRH
ncbi:hypothetical protein KC340_g5021 [Hortaea werneckii]|nr:hypothetical protein KC342_g11983 [Hortaea werneckii]KAI7105077.1 hypothetical protein KC339_g4094 [Hortaea werneckii]KAI7221717.1 hypothetical protein KC365_g11623 [Hortaea werneckii]KAI7328619.1 hypothetical protein KC340_g5021 [Hortaea werneckii]KAI7393051.1 hypothetical protein KC328_g6787 [Hortaea werneckii]